MAVRYRFDDVEVDVQSFRLLKAGRARCFRTQSIESTDFSG